jgi:glycolate oxidase FAD binding subunit
MVTAEELLSSATATAGGHAWLATSTADHVDGVVPRVVVAPATIDDVARTLAWASDARLSVVLRGSGTKDRWGRVPGPVDVVLRLDRLNHVIAHEASDLTATVEAGARLRGVNRHLARHGQYLPFDPPHADHATIGGVLATNDIGPLRHRFGSPRDLLIGMTIVMADGSVSSSGGRVVKNVAGYDIGRLMTGSHGCLAAIVSATFKLAPLPPFSRTLRVRAARASDVPAFTDLLRQNQCEPEALEVHLERRAGNNSQVSLLVRYATVEPAVDDACRQTRMCAEQIGAGVETADGADAERWWSGHVAAPAAAGRMQLRLSWKPSEFERAAGALHAAVGDADVDWIGRAAVGSGLMGIGGDPARHAAVVGELRAGPVFTHVVVVDAPANLRREVDVWNVPAPQRALWQALKVACDPSQVLGAGRGPL